MPLKPREVIDANDPRVSKFGHPAPPWLVNYADLMTELVCFFIILYALSAALNKNMQNAKEELEKMMEEEQLQGEVKMTKEGLHLTLEEQEGAAYFESGKSEITPQGQDILGKVAPVLSTLPNEVVIEGHTDNVPIHTSVFDSNWELSTARATNVVKYLVNNESLPPERLAAIGYGEYKPIAENDTPENRAKNRRVVFFIKNK
ncbi:MAG: flagellar motor protein MotB [Endomicrobiales bacterium]|nr:flagellar motor protein MotB [Endomicrobiales bacterium]